MEENKFSGILSINDFGNGFVNCEYNNEKIVVFVSKKNLNFGLHNTIVSGIIKEKTDKGYVGIITSQPSFIGKMYVGKVHHIFKNDVYIYLEQFGKSNIIISLYGLNLFPEIKKNDIVIVIITSADSINNKIYCKIDSFYKDLDNDIFSKIHNLPEREIKDFELIPCPKKVERRDLLDHNVFTIDPLGSKDLDDAFSVKKIDDEKYNIYVHIADTTEYIYPEHEYFEKIMKNGNTIYGINHNSSMIPRNLSEYICSILPSRETKFSPTTPSLSSSSFIKNTYTITNEFSYDKKNNTITHIGYYYSEINSRKQYTYEEIDEIIANDSNNNYNKSCTKDILIILESSKLIQQKLDTMPMNNSTSLSHKMIENWMIYTNNIMGNIIFNKNAGNFRYHPKPYNNQLLALKRFIINIFKEPIPQIFDRQYIIETLRKNLDKITDESILTTYEYIIKDMMRKASYEPYTKPHNHYALGLENYLHFTSPIRRASDMINHLILRGYEFDDTTMQKYCKYFNDAEMVQIDVENMILSNKIFKNMSKKIGTKIKGVTININKNNIEIYLPEIDYSSYIHVSLLSNKFLNFDSNNNVLSNDDNIYNMFDVNEYNIKSVNEIYKIIELEIVK
jgi:ribonuclease R